MRQMVSFTLKGAGYTVVEEVDGVDALNKAKAEKFVCVVTDVNMPNKDGIALIADLRALPDYKCIPMLMLTTESGMDKKQAGKAAGASGWIVKPFNPDQLLKTIKKVLG
jgi:two-component system chemotaxis response regulator CheY